MSLYKQPKSRYWWASYRDSDGLLRRRSTGCRERSNAQLTLSGWELGSVDTSIDSCSRNLYAFR